MLRYMHTIRIRMQAVLALLFIMMLPVAAQENLSKSEAEEKRAQIIETWGKAKEAQFRKILEAQNGASPTIYNGNDSLPFWYTAYGNAPFGDRSLWISMHGGGGTTHKVNDGQWNNQKHLYKPAEGIYVAPRAPWNAWNMWFQEPIDKMFEELTQMMIVCKGVNPNKVYLMGYSAGGDGVWRLAPRMADHFAAASMMAGHPGDVGLQNLRNLPFMIWCGAEDAAYNRNDECAKRGKEMDSLQLNCPDGYIHQTHILPQKGHWMDREDAAALPWMEKFVRNPYPDTIIWRQEDVLRDCFYWISVPREEIARGKEVRISVKKNTIHIERCDYSRLTLYLNDNIVNLDKKVKVKKDGKVLYNGKVLRSAQVMAETMERRGDPMYCFPARLVVDTQRHQ